MEASPSEVREAREGGITATTESGSVTARDLERSNKHLRQLDFFNPDAHQLPVSIIGVGSVGSFIALTLAKMGVRDIKIWDPDRIDEHNLSNQFYRKKDVGSRKAIALQEIIRQYEDITIEAHASHYGWDGRPLRGIIISAVDSIRVRREIWKMMKAYGIGQIHYIDTRMGGELMRIYPVDTRNKEAIEYYEKSLDTSSNAPAELPCTGRTIIYNVLVIAGLTADLVKKIIREEELPRELIFNLNQFEFYHVRGEDGKVRKSKNRKKAALATA